MPTTVTIGKKMKKEFFLKMENATKKVRKTMVVSKNL